ncbi:MAG: sulfatase-like hydrolase/transferase [Actinobacteria bacterium]|nr:sulfatase-like hydrolase/transferase [Actinomycetota bacterium]
MPERNFLILCSDQHNPDVLGYNGHKIVQTPHLDELASHSVNFVNAITPSPICVPARASLATGRYVHQLGTWDNSAPYTGAEAPSWGHRLAEGGYSVTTIGKLHYRNASDPTGFADQRIPLHIRGGTGDPYPLLRGRALPKAESRVPYLHPSIGPSEYSRYDAAIEEETIAYLRSTTAVEGPWALFVSFANPHFPLAAEQRHLDKYPLDAIELPSGWAPEEWPTHPGVATVRHLEMLDEPIGEHASRLAIATYYAMVTCLDERIGRILQTLRESRIDDRTTIIYTSDHGDMLGSHGLWSKHVMYRPSVGVPMLFRDPDVPEGSVCTSNVSLIDIFPTLVQNTETTDGGAEAELPGRSLRDISVKPDRQRIAFSEYHANYSADASFMVTDSDYKFVYHVGTGNQLFDLRNDKGELTDLAGQPGLVEVELRLLEELRRLVDPEAVDAEAKRSQALRLEAAGGANKVLEAGNTMVYTPAPGHEGKK